VDNAAKAREDAAKKAQEAQEKLNRSIQEGTKKVEELQKQYTRTIDNLFIKTGSNNPFVKIFDEGNKAINELRQNLKGLSPALIAEFENLQRTLNGNQLFSAKLDNSLEAFDLRSQADKFRNAQSSKPLEITDKSKFFNDFIDAGLKQIQQSGGAAGVRYNPSFTSDGKGFLGYTQTQNNPNIKYNSNIFTDANGQSFTSGFTQSDARDDILSTYDRTYNRAGVFGVLKRQRTYEDLTESEKQKYLSSLDKGDNLNIQQRLDNQLKIVDLSNPANPEQRDIADRKILSLAQNIDPTKLTDTERNKIADAADRRAEKTEKAQNEANVLSNKRLDLDGKLLVEITKLNEAVGKEGLKALITIEDNSNGAAKVREGSQPNRKDTEKTYNQD
jgi:hypothetical protein